MACMKPIELFYNLKEHKYQMSYTPDCDVNRSIIVSCGRCPACAKNWRNQLAQRARYEYLAHTDCCMVELTVDDDHLEEVFPNLEVDHAYFQKFMKRLRITLERHYGFTGRIKYLVGAEYGELNGRPHFHLIIYGWKPHDLRFLKRSKKKVELFRSDFLASIWKAGFVTVSNVTEKSAPYVAKYVAKFKEVKQEDFMVVQLIGEEKVERKVRKPYLVYPREMLGYKWFLEHAVNILRRGYLQTSTGVKVPIPRRYLEKLEHENCTIYGRLDIYRALREYESSREEYFLEQLREHIQNGRTTHSERYEYALMLGQKHRANWIAFNRTRLNIGN